MKHIGTAPQPHPCSEELPRNKFFHKHPLCYKDSVVECSCGKRYIWRLFMEGGGYWDLYNGPVA